jgi:hypothetical protein
MNQPVYRNKRLDESSIQEVHKGHHEPRSAKCPLFRGLGAAEYQGEIRHYFRVTISTLYLTASKKPQVHLRDRQQIVISEKSTHAFIYFSLFPHSISFTFLHGIKNTLNPILLFPAAQNLPFSF